MSYILASLNCYSHYEISIAAETIELYGKQWLSPSFIQKASYLEEIYKTK